LCQIQSCCVGNKLQSDYALVAPAGECLWGESLAWLIGAVVCSLVAEAGNCLLGMQWMATLALQHHWSLANQLPLLTIIKRGWSGFLPVRRAI